MNIFLAGNSSKNHHVGSLIEKTFPKSKFVLVDQIADGKDSEKRYAITPKTAVAIGQLNLNNFASSTDQSSFKLHVGFFNLGNGVFKEILKMGEQDKDWKQFKKIRNGKVDVFYSNCLPVEGSMNRTASKTLKIDDAEGKYLFVRVKDQLVIEYCVGDSIDSLSDKVSELSFVN